ncbi:glucose-6-phosphate 1-dehydrogenase 4, chloroplastic isoform X1 [Cucurbita moschata]|uniref:Glucose-6-phosphate 1-dehydrogenase n=1 Tax=Cucurbita moschata TaxID=3662 RepID=A0A6J1G2U5_CUCMO|nr:glucose-6-phosphate 1-dehydrogenase 4, chloroplastic isoform X1 [Cucurbita moschata]
MPFSISIFSAPPGAIPLCSNVRRIPHCSYHIAPNRLRSRRASNFCQIFHGLRLWISESLSLLQHNGKSGQTQKFKTVKNHKGDEFDKPFEETSSQAQQVPEAVLKSNLSSDSNSETTKTSTHPAASENLQSDAPDSSGSSGSLPQSLMSNRIVGDEEVPSLCIAVIGATGELATRKIFPALFALYYSGFLPENVGIFGYSRKNITDEELRSIISATLTCRIDHQQNCSDKMDAFLSRTFHVNGGYDNNKGMSKLNFLMEQIERYSEANRIFYLSVPQDALLDVALSLSSKAQTKKGWNRVIIEKPFGFDMKSSHFLTKSLLSQFEENQIYRIDHLLGKNLIENLTVLRFANLVFQPLWSRTFISSVQVILSEELGVQTKRFLDGGGIIGDIVHSHILQTIALLAMEPPISLDGEAIRNEKVKLLRSIRPLEPSDVVLGQYKSSAKDKVDLFLDDLTPTYFAGALYIDNARWDGVPFLIKSGLGLIKHSVEIRIQFRQVPGNIYREHIGYNSASTTNEIILRDIPEEAILVRVNNKVPGLGLRLDSPELNLLYKDKYNVDVPDSYEHLLLDVIDGDSHLFMRSDELAVAWNILTPILNEIKENNIKPELYEFGGRGPIGAYYLWAKHGVRWVEE